MKMKMTGMRRACNNNSQGTQLHTFCIDIPETNVHFLIGGNHSREAGTHFCL
jgi:hypothetical protein